MSPSPITVSVDFLQQKVKEGSKVVFIVVGTTLPGSEDFFRHTRLHERVDEVNTLCSVDFEVLEVLNLSDDFVHNVCERNLVLPSATHFMYKVVHLPDVESNKRLRPIEALQQRSPRTSVSSVRVGVAFDDLLSFRSWHH